MSDEQSKLKRIGMYIAGALGVILFLAVLFRDLVLAILMGNARGLSNEAKKEDSALKEQQDKAINQAASEEAKAKEAADRIANRTENDIDEDWHKRS